MVREVPALAAQPTRGGTVCCRMPSHVSDAPPRYGPPLQRERWRGKGEGQLCAGYEGKGGARVAA